MDEQCIVNTDGCEDVSEKDRIHKDASKSKLATQLVPINVGNRANDVSITKQINRNEKPYSCCHCKKTFTKKGFLIRHINAHLYITSPSCSMCSASFTSEQDLIEHIIPIFPGWGCPGLTL